MHAKGMDSWYTTVSFVLNYFPSVPLLIYLLVFSYAMHIFSQRAVVVHRNPNNFWNNKPYYKHPWKENGME